jgi:hypothetical protein
MKGNYLTIEEVTSFCLTTCEGATGEHKLFFKRWIIAAMRDIGPNRSWYKTATLYAKDFTFCKPDDLVSTINIALFDAQGCEIHYKFNQGSKRIFTDRATINGNIISQIELSEDAHYFHLSSNAVDVAQALIRYFAMPIDADGFPIVPENNLLAYEAFCGYMWAKRKKNSQSEIAQSYEIWLRERDRVKGNNKIPSIIEAERIFKKYLSLVSTPTYRDF